MSYKIVYRRYASLFFIVGVDATAVCFVFERGWEDQHVYLFFLRMNWGYWSLFTHM